MTVIIQALTVSSVLCQPNKSVDSVAISKLLQSCEDEFSEI